MPSHSSPAPGWFLVGRDRLSGSGAVLLVALLGAACSDPGTNPSSGHPVPELIHLSIDSVLAGAPSLEITASGGGFVPATVAHWNDEPRPTRVQGDRRLSVTLSAADLAAGDVGRITVVNPAPGGGTSRALPVRVLNPLPTVRSLSVDTATAGRGPLILEVEGSGFVATSQLEWRHSLWPATLLGPTRLRVELADSAFLSGGTIDVRVVNPSPGGGTSGAVHFTVRNPVPAVHTASPAAVARGSGVVEVTLEGSGFTPLTTVRLDGQLRSHGGVSATRLQVRLEPGDFRDAGVRLLRVENPAPGGGVSGPVPVTVTNPPPRLLNLPSGSAVVGSEAFELRLDGADFVDSTLVLWNGQPRPTRLISPNQVAVSIPATDLVAPGTAQLGVSTPGPGGGTSEARPFRVRNLPVARTIDARVVTWPIWDVRADPVRGLLFATVGRSGIDQPCHVIALRPETADIVFEFPICDPWSEQPIHFDLDPGGDYVHVFISNRETVRRVMISSVRYDLEFHAGRRARLTALPAAPRTVVAASDDFLRVYDDGIARPRGHTGSWVAFSDRPGELLALGGAGQVYVLEMAPDGLTPRATHPGLFTGNNAGPVALAAGRLYSATGRWVDPYHGEFLREFALGGSNGAVVPVPESGRVLFVVHQQLLAFDLNTGRLLGSHTLPEPLITRSGYPARLVRWGEDGLAYPANAGLVILRTTLLH